MDNEGQTEADQAPPARGMLLDDAQTYRPGIRWIVWIPLVTVILAISVSLYVTDLRRGQRLRTHLLQEHALLTQTLAPPYRELRAKIERLTLSVGEGWQGPFTAPGFTMAQLMAEPSLYGRVRMGELHGPGGVAASIRHRYADQVGSCLGIEFAPVHELYDRGEFLMPSYVESVSRVHDADRLAALRQDLQFRLRRDTPDIVQWTRRRYFVLAMDEAAVSVDGPTRLYIWDLRNERLLLRARADSGQVMLVPISISGVTTARRVGAAPDFNLTQHDCAVANAAREQLGVSVLSLQNAGAVAGPAEPPAAQPATPAAPAANRALAAPHDGH